LTHDASGQDQGRSDQSYGFKQRVVENTLVGGTDRTSQGRGGPEESRKRWEKNNGVRRKEGGRQKSSNSCQQIGGSTKKRTSVWAGLKNVKEVSEHGGQRGTKCAGNKGHPLIKICPSRDRFLGKCYKQRPRLRTLPGGLPQGWECCKEKTMEKGPMQYRCTDLKGKDLQKPSKIEGERYCQKKNRLPEGRKLRLLGTCNKKKSHRWGNSKDRLLQKSLLRKVIHQYHHREAEYHGSAKEKKSGDISRGGGSGRRPAMEQKCHGTIGNDPYPHHLRQAKKSFTFIESLGHNSSKILFSQSFGQGRPGAYCSLQLRKSKPAV